MNQYLIFSVGFLAQILFSARQITQWISSERAGRILSPLLFWQLSILASFLMITYGVLRSDLAIVLGQIVTYGVYLRNLYYHGFWAKIPVVIRYPAILFPVAAGVWLSLGGAQDLSHLFTNEDIPGLLMAWGIVGQFVFTFRFIYQWLYCERHKQSLLPVGFWIISLGGSIMVLSYAIIRRDPVLFIGQLFGCLVYSRNLLIWRKQDQSLGS